MTHAEATTVGTDTNLSVRRFYALEYFYILLRSVERSSDNAHVFKAFVIMKQEHRLGESKFQRLSDNSPEMTPGRESRYRYTFRQVIEEAKLYLLISESEDNCLALLNDGRSLLEQYGTPGYSRTLLRLMERNSNAFRYLVERMFSVNRNQPGLLVFPVYSPYQLGLQRREIRTSDDIRGYALELGRRIESDLKLHLGETVNLSGVAEKSTLTLEKDEILPKSNKEPFNARNYNVIVSRIRKFWLLYFLRELYKFELSLSSFDIWVYRAKQCGVVHVTEFYPGFQGRIVFPTSVIVSDARSQDFHCLYTYRDGKCLHVHEPAESNEQVQDRFIKCIVEHYYTLRRMRRGYFVHLASLRELTCFTLKISEMTFERLLNQIYKLNLAGTLPIQISLEVDRMPEEVGAEYLKRVPVEVDGKPRNIIAIDVIKGRQRNE